MEAPAPASALIHSATLISAGIFLIIKFFLIFQLNNFVRVFFIIIGVTTCLFGSIVSTAQTDLKKLLAYSTISNCGFLISSPFLSNIENSIIFFKIHGFFKSLSFLFVSYLISVYGHIQDIRNIGIVKLYDRLFLFLFLISLSFLSSFFFSKTIFIKHIILDTLSNSLNYFLIKSIQTLCSIVSLSYSLRLFTCFFSYNKYTKNNNELSIVTKMPIIIFYVYVLVFSVLIFYNSFNTVSMQISNNYFSSLILLAFLLKIIYNFVVKKISHNIKFLLTIFFFFF